MATRILIADDDPLLIEVVQTHLAAQGFEVISASEGEAALRLVKEQNPAVVVLDVMMPGVDGFQVLRRLREDESTRALPVIMLTARQFEQDVREALKLGVREYLAKPFTPEALRARVERALGKSAS